MSFRVEITATAFAEIRQSYLWMAEQSEAAAERWLDSLLAALETLADNPLRCSLAPEYEDSSRELRQLIVGKRRNIYRVLFEVRGETVFVLRIRHGAQALLDADEL
jgi:plasmid stabilization system protein ParE